MKKFLLTCLILASATFCFGASKMYIKSQNAELLEKASSFAKAVSTVEFGDEVTVTDEDKDWSFVESKENPAAKGWIKTVNLSKRKLTTKSSANAKEIALAGKGFSAEVENLYANSEDGNFEAVNKVEMATVDKDVLLSFILEGELQGADK